MTRNSHRWIIFIFHVSLINAQSLSPIPKGLQPGHQVSAKTTVFAVLITVFFLVGLLSIYIRHCIHPNPEYSNGYPHHRNYHGRSGLENAVIESFPVFAFSTVKESKIGNSDLECAICLNEFEDRETVRLLPICDHLFHIDCIDAWLYSHATCPVCRADLTANKQVKTDDSPVRDHVVIDIDDLVARREISGKFPRSNSTGHSMDRLSDCGFERFTLRLPEDVKRRIMAAKGRRLKRTRSFDGDLTEKYWWSGEESSYRIGSGGVWDRVNWVDRWSLFVSKSNSGSVRSKSNSGSVRSNGESLK